MNTTITQDRVNELQEYLAQNKKALERLTSLKTALEDYTKDTINKTFFEKYFATGEKDYLGKLRTTFYLDKSEKPWDDFTHKIYIGGYSYDLELKSTKRLDILGVTNAKIEQVNSWINQANEQISKLSAFDEDALIDELKQLYAKHGKPEHWHKILERVRFISLND